MPVIRNPYARKKPQQLAGTGSSMTHQQPQLENAKQTAKASKTTATIVSRPSPASNETRAVAHVKNGAKARSSTNQSLPSASTERKPSLASAQCTETLKPVSKQVGTPHEMATSPSQKIVPTAAGKPATTTAMMGTTKTFKAQLRQQIQDLKRAKRFKAQLKIDRERQQQLELQKQQKKAEMEQERQRKEKERIQREQERQAKLRQKEQERLEKAQRKEQERVQREQRKEEERLKKQEERRQWLAQVERERQHRLELQRRHLALQPQQHRPYYPHAPLPMSIEGPGMCHANHQHHWNISTAFPPGRIIPQVPPHQHPPARLAGGSAPPQPAEHPTELVSSVAANSRFARMMSPVGSTTTRPPISGGLVSPSPTHHNNNHHQNHSHRCVPFPAASATRADIPPNSLVTSEVPSPIVNKTPDEAESTDSHRNSNSVTQTSENVAEILEDHISNTVNYQVQASHVASGEQSRTSETPLEKEQDTAEGKSLEMDKETGQTMTNVSKVHILTKEGLQESSSPSISGEAKSTSIHTETPMMDDCSCDLVHSIQPSVSSSTGSGDNTKGSSHVDRQLCDSPPSDLDKTKANLASDEGYSENKEPSPGFSTLSASNSSPQHGLSPVQQKSTGVTCEETSPTAEAIDCKIDGVHASTAADAYRLDQDVLTQPSVSCKSDEIINVKSGSRSDHRTWEPILMVAAGPSKDVHESTATSSTCTPQSTPGNVTNPLAKAYPENLTKSSNLQSLQFSTTRDAAPQAAVLNLLGQHSRTGPVVDTTERQNLVNGAVHKVTTSNPSHQSPFSPNLSQLKPAPITPTTWVQQAQPSYQPPWPYTPAYRGGFMHSTAGYNAQNMLPPPFQPYQHIPMLTHNPTQMGSGRYPWHANPMLQQSTSAFASTPIPPSSMHNGSTFPQQHFWSSSTQPTPLPAVVPKSTMSVSSVKQPPRGSPRRAGLNPILEKLVEAMEPPSPFTSTHALLAEPIVIIRKCDEKFGVNVRCERRSGLVDAEWLQAQGYLRGASIIEQGKHKTQTLQPRTMPVGDKETETLAHTQTNSGHSKIEDKISLSNETTNPGSNEASDLSTPVVPNALKPKRQRRRRVFFGVMYVVDAVTQNSRTTRPEHGKAKLEEGDIILSINGQSVANRPFSEACGLFPSNQTSENEVPVGQSTVISATLVVARLKSKLPLATPVAKSTPIPSPATKTGPEQTVLSKPNLVTGEFTSRELATLASCIMQVMSNDSPGAARLLGQSLSEESLRNVISTTILARRAFTSVKERWTELVDAIEEEMTQRASTHWKQEWLKESPDVRLRYVGLTEGWTDAQRTHLRNLPRPARGCRCGREDHEYVNDPKCALYGNLSRLDQSDMDKDDKGKKLKKNEQRHAKKGLNAVEAAFKDRIVKLQAAKHMEETEARFVATMERIQVQRAKQAVFAPNLTAMVLSAIMAIDAEFDDGAPEALSIMAKDGDDGSDEEEDLPLSALGKRKPTGQAPQDSKRQKVPLKLRFAYVARLLAYISKTWGHVYKEPSHADYAWRWEVFHGHNSEEASWESKARNPRIPGSLSFEKIHFGITHLSSKINCLDSFNQALTMNCDTTSSEEAVRGCKVGIEDDIEISKASTWLAHLLSPSRTGVLDELLAFVKMGVISLSRSGIPRLESDWVSKVDIILLDELGTMWSRKLDPDRLYGINSKLATELENHWARTELGWAMGDDPDDLFFDFEELDEWRRSFEGKMQAKANLAEGIGRFGL